MAGRRVAALGAAAREVAREPPLADVFPVDLPDEAVRPPAALRGALFRGALFRDAGRAFLEEAGFLRAVRAPRLPVAPFFEADPREPRLEPPFFFELFRAPDLADFFFIATLVLLYRAGDRRTSIIQLRR